jgi:hypothetical protein
MVIDGKNPPRSSDSKRKNRAGKTWRQVFKNDMLDELRRELRLIDKTIAVLIRLSRLRQPSRRPKGRRFDFD